LHKYTKNIQFSAKLCNREGLIPLFYSSENQRIKISDGKKDEEVFYQVGEVGAEEGKYFTANYIKRNKNKQAYKNS